MSNTTFAEFEDSDETFLVGDPVKIIAGDYSGEGGEIEEVLVTSGYYLVRTVAGKRRLVDGLEMEPQNVPEVDTSMYGRTPSFGITSAQLADEVADTITRCTSRIVGVGNDQYSRESCQKFEAMPVDELMEMSLEELDDVINYAVMLGIRFKRIRDAVRRAVD